MTPKMLRHFAKAIIFSQIIIGGCVKTMPFRILLYVFSLDIKLWVNTLNPSLSEPPVPFKWGFSLLHKFDQLLRNLKTFRLNELN